MKIIKTCIIDGEELELADELIVLELNNLEHLTLKSCKEVKQLYPEFVKLPKLKYGTVLERPELYEK